MALETSFWGEFTSEGRLKNQWARALADPDPASSLNRLRAVQQRLREKPTAFAHLWMPFLNTFLDATRVRALTDGDLTASTEMGNALVGLASLQVRPEEIWARIVVAHDARGEERQARALLTRIYNAQSTSSEAKERCARDLARRGARGDEHLDIYVDYLQRVTRPDEETDALKLLATIFAVDFDSGTVRLRRAGEVAERLAKRRIEIAGLRTALALHSLLIEQNPAKAARDFETALQVNRNDRVALVGLLAASIRNGAYGNIAGIAQSIKHLATDAVVAGLVKLSATLHWLDSYVITGSSPADTKSLENLKGLDLKRYVGDVVDVAIGRLHLLEGNAQRAAEVLLPLVDRHPEQPSWGYYAAWAAALVGDHKGVARRFSALAKWSGRWTVACLLLDADPALAEENKVYLHLGEMSKMPGTRVYAPIIEARVALARSSPPAIVKWEVGSETGTIEEHLEALRTVLGCAIYTRDSAAMVQAIALPLFKRLPLADQVMWRGLQALLAGDQVQGRALLEEAAIKFGYRRAALVLAVHFLEQNKVSEAKQFLERAAAGRTDAKLALLRAYIDGCEGRTERAAGQFEKLVAHGEPRAHYALGNLYLERAEQARRASQSDSTRLYREQAAGAFGAALKTVKRSLPTDCEALANCATFVAHPKSPTAIVGIQRALEGLDASRRRPWLIWHAALAQIWYGKPSEVAAACEEVLALLEDVGHLEDSAAVVLTQAVARACIKAEDVGQAETLADLLGRLSKNTGLPTVKRFSRLGISATARVRYMKSVREGRARIRQQVARLATSDPGNGSLAFLSAYINLESRNLEEAVVAMRNAQPEDNFERHLCASLADLLEGHAPSLEVLPKAEQNAVPEVIQGCHLLSAARAFAAGEPDEGYKAVLVAMRKEARDTTTIVNIGRFLPSLCSQLTEREAVPPYLVEAVRKMSKASGGIAQAASVARCAAAIGELEIAYRLWEQVLAKDSPTSPLRREFVDLLCYMAVTAHRAGRHLEAVDRLRQAADQLR